MKRLKLQTQKDYTIVLNQYFQMMFDPNYKVNRLEVMQMKYISGVASTKSPTKISELTASNRKKLLPHRDNTRVKKYKWTQNYVPSKYYSSVLYNRSYPNYSPIYNKKRGVMNSDLVQKSVDISVSTFGYKFSCTIIRFNNKLLCNHLLKSDCIDVPYRVASRFKEDTIRTKHYYREGILETLLFAYIFQGKFSSLDECLSLTRFFRTFKEKDGVDSNKHRYSSSKASYNKLSPHTQSLFTVDEIRTSEGKLITAYFVDFNLTDMFLGFLPLSILSVNQDKSDTFVVDIAELIEMSSMGQIICIDRLSCIEGTSLYIKLYEKNEIAMCGRRYNTLNMLARFDRYKIKTLKGYDMESALQSILYAKFSSEVPMPWTKHYISNKSAVRAEYTSLSGLDIETVKTEITAIYQGRSYDPDTYPIHELLTELFGEVVKVRDFIFNTYLGKHSSSEECYIYSRKRTKEKLPSGTSKRKQKNTFMFFYWTYFERKVQNTMCEYIKEPLTLHDAVYTQMEQLPDMLTLEKRIFESTGIDMKLGIA